MDWREKPGACGRLVRHSCPEIALTLILILFFILPLILLFFLILLLFFLLLLFLLLLGFFGFFEKPLGF